jgi:hypothetical protein
VYPRRGEAAGTLQQQQQQQQHNIVMIIGQSPSARAGRRPMPAIVVSSHLTYGTPITPTGLLPARMRMSFVLPLNPMGKRLLYGI